MIQTPAVSLPSAARGCWLVCFCRAALWCFKEFPNLLAVWRGSNPWLVEASMALTVLALPPGLQGSQPPRRPCTDRQTNRALRKRSRCLRQGSAALFTHHHGHLGISSSRVSPAMPVPGGGCSRLCHVPRQAQRQDQYGNVDSECWASPRPQAGSSP